MLFARIGSLSERISRRFFSFKYDPFGRRIYKSSSTATSVYAFDDRNLIEEVNSAGVVVARYAQGLNLEEPLAMLRSSATSYYEEDGLLCCWSMRSRPRAERGTGPGWTEPSDYHGGQLSLSLVQLVKHPTTPNAIPDKPECKPGACGILKP